MNKHKGFAALLPQTLRRVMDHHRKLVMRLIGFVAAIAAIFASYQNRLGTAYAQREIVQPGLGSSVQVIALSICFTAVFWTVPFLLGMGKSERLSQVQPDEHRFERLLLFAATRPWVPSFFTAFVRRLQRFDNKLPWLLTIAFFAFFQATSWVNGQISVAKLPVVSGAAVAAGVSLLVVIVKAFRNKENRILPFLSLAGTLCMISWWQHLDVWAFLPAIVAGVAATGMTIYGRKQSQGGFGMKGAMISAVLAAAFFGLPVLIIGHGWHWWTWTILTYCCLNGLSTVLAALLYNWSNKHQDESMALIATSTNSAWAAVVGFQVLGQPVPGVVGIGIALLLASAIIRVVLNHRAAAKKRNGATANATNAAKPSRTQRKLDKARYKLALAAADVEVAEAEVALEHEQTKARERLEEAKREGARLRDRAAVDDARLKAETVTEVLQLVGGRTEELTLAKKARRTAKKAKTKPQSKTL